MQTCCVSCKKSTVNKRSTLKRTKQNRLLFVSNCGICNKKKIRFIKNQKPSGLLSKLGIKIPLSNIPLIGEFQKLF